MGDSTDLTDEEIANWSSGRPVNPTTESGVRMALEIRRHRAAQTASAEHAAMLLLDGLTGRRSANVFEAARNVEVLIACIPGRPVVQEPSARGRDSHDAAAPLVGAFMDGAAYVHDHSEVDDDGRIVLERGANVERAAEQHVRDHEGASKETQVLATAGEGTDHQIASADVRAVVRAAAADVLFQAGAGGVHDVSGRALLAGAIADRVVAQLTAPPPGHVCSAPYALEPEDLDVLSELVSHAELVDWPHARTAVRKVLAAHTCPEPTIEPLPEVIECGTSGCVSSIKKTYLPSGWRLTDGVWACPRCKVLATTEAS